MAESHKADFDTSLTDREKASLRYLEYACSGINKSEQNEAIAIIKNYSQQQLVRLIRDPHCVHLKKVCETNIELQESWKSTLSSCGLPDLTIQSRSQDSVSHPILHHYVSGYVLELFANCKRSQGAENQQALMLNELCDKWGSYAGLSMRSEFNCKLLSKNFSTCSPKLIDSLVNKIKLDAKTLTDLYGQIGYMKAGFINLKLANIFLESKSVEDRDRGKLFFEEAQKEFLCASLLEDDQYSKNIVTAITRGQGLVAIFKEENAPFESLNAFKQDLMKKVGRDIYTVLSARAESEIGSIKSTPQTSPEPAQHRL